MITKTRPTFCVGCHAELTGTACDYCGRPALKTAGQRVRDVNAQLWELSRRYEMLRLPLMNRDLSGRPVPPARSGGPGLLAVLAAVVLGSFWAMNSGPAAAGGTVLAAALLAASWVAARRDRGRRSRYTALTRAYLRRRDALRARLRGWPLRGQR